MGRGGGFILVNNDNYFLSIPSVRPQEHIICNFLGITIYIGVYGTFPHMDGGISFLEQWFGDSYLTTLVL